MHIQLKKSRPFYPADQTQFLIELNIGCIEVLSGGRQNSIYFYDSDCKPFSDEILHEALYLALKSENRVIDYRDFDGFLKMAAGKFEEKTEKQNAPEKSLEDFCQFCGKDPSEHSEKLCGSY